MKHFDSQLAVIVSYHFLYTQLYKYYFANLNRCHLHYELEETAVQLTKTDLLYKMRILFPCSIFNRQCFHLNEKIVINVQTCEFNKK